MPQTLTRPSQEAAASPAPETTQQQTPVLPSVLPTRRKRWTQDECEFLEGLRMLPARYELLDGEIVEKMGQNKPHGFSVVRALFWLAGVFGQDRVATQVTMQVRGPDRTTNRPEPDVLVVSDAPTLDARPHEATDVLLIVEVCDTTQHDDLRLKPGLYARAGVGEYWVLDLPTRRLIVHRRPTEGEYAEVLAYTEDETAAPDVAPDAGVRVGDLLPPPPAAGTEPAV